MPVFLLPDLGEGLTEAAIVTWLVEEGDTVAVDQPVVEVETAKAAVEVPVPFAGVVTRRHGTPGATLAVGSPLLEVQPAGFDEPGVVTPAPTAQAPRGSRQTGSEQSGSEQTGSEEGSGSVLIGYGTSAAPPRRAGRRRHRRPVSDPVTAGRPAAAPAVISPIVRKLARAGGLDLRELTGSGFGGTITRRDVEGVLAARTGPPAPEPPVRDAPDEPGVRRVPLTGVRKATADKLSRSRREIPEATVWVDVDATELLAARASLTAAAPDRPVGLLALLARFALLGLRRFPELNGRVEGDELVLPDAVHLGFAAQTDRGLVVPVVRDAHRLTTRDLSAALADRTARARAGRLAPADLSGGTFTVNNHGVFGLDGAAAIINHPEIAILGIGRVVPRPWVVDGELAVRSVAQLGLAFDHRACDGGTAGGFVRFVADCVESPVRALGDL
ncbi:dihydrolipoamide acetyltransferase family protein [Modestobacter roseus]|uniref:dihydrolipoamide acetyltransferase family protein n=1 Tax=Modestobacter roseus TaxID=1181884 RepID=UPI0034DE40BF